MDILCSMPNLWKVMKGSCFGFESPQQQVDVHASSKNTFTYKMHLFLPFYSMQNTVYTV